MSFKIKGLDELEKQFKQMEKNAKELEKETTIPFDELFTTSFMRKCSSFLSFDDLLKAGNFEVNTQADFETIPDNTFDIHISTTTTFHTWQDMLDEATSEYAIKKLGF